MPKTILYSVSIVWMFIAEPIVPNSPLRATLSSFRDRCRRKIGVGRDVFAVGHIDFVFTCNAVLLDVHHLAFVDRLYFGAARAYDFSHVALVALHLASDDRQSQSARFR